MLTCLLWIMLGAAAPAHPPAPAPATVSPELTDPFAPSLAQPRIPPGRVAPSHPPLLSPFAPRHRNLRAPATPTVHSPFDA